MKPVVFVRETPGLDAAKVAQAGSSKWLQQYDAYEIFNGLVEDGWRDNLQENPIFNGKILENTYGFL